MDPLRPAPELGPDEEPAEGRYTLETLIQTLWEDRAAARAPPGDRFRLKAPVFNGEGDVEQFLQEFHKVAVASEWPAHVELLQLRSCLAGQAKPYAVGPSSDYICEALRTRFRLTVRGARAHLQGLRRDSNVSLQDHANKVEQLVQVAYANVDLETRQSLVFDAFLQSLNNLGLQRYLLAAGVDTIDAALTRGRAYFQIGGMQDCDSSARCVNSDWGEAAECIRPGPRVAAAATTPSTPPELSRILEVVDSLQGEVATLRRAQTADRPDRSYSSRPDKDAQLEPRVAATSTSPPTSPEFSKILEVVRDLQTEVKALRRVQTTSQLNRPRSSRPEELPLTCWRCGTTGHMRRDCPQGRSGPLNTQGLR